MNCNSKFLKVGAIALLEIVWALGASAVDTNYELRPINLPGASGAVALDYFAYDRATGKLWVPASNTGSVDIIDSGTDAVSQISGFPTGEIERRGHKITVGPTAATIGDGVVYIGNRGNSNVCVIDAKSSACGECLPVAKSLLVFDASDPHHLKPKSKIPLDHIAEGYAVDNERGIFYTNIEEAGVTVAIDVRTHDIISKWNPGSTDLQGLALDNARRFLFVACGDHVVSLDAAHDGKIVDSLQTGAGLDNIDYSAEKKLLYAAASQAATLTIAEVGDDGKFHLKATVPTVKGSRGVIAGKGETAYLIDPAEGKILKLTRK